MKACRVEKKVTPTPYQVLMRRASTQRLIVMLWIGLSVSLIASCRLPFGKPDRDASVRELMVELDTAYEEGRHQDTMMASYKIQGFDPDSTDEVWSSARALGAAYEDGDPFQINNYLSQLSAALQHIAQDYPNPTWQDTAVQGPLNEAEQILRAVNTDVFLAWNAAPNEDLELIFLVSSETYLTHFAEAILVADVLWNKAEYLEASGRRMEAVGVYEELKAKDYTSKYQMHLGESLGEVWEEASRNTPLPTDLTEPLEVPSPHKEWIEIAFERVAEDFDSPTSRFDLLRIAEIWLAYVHSEEAYEILLDLATSGEDVVALDAATMYLTHVADTEEDIMVFIDVVLELEENDYLTEIPSFNLLVKTLEDRYKGN